MSATRVLVTGAAGRIGSTLREGFRGAFSVLRLTDVREITPAFAGEEIVQADLSEFDAILRAAAGIDVIVHLGAIPGEDTFERLLSSNIVATYHVFEAARRQGVRRVVFASTNHVTGFYPASQQIGPNDPIRPDSLYGVSKAFGEALGRLYADKFELEVVCVRIGAFGERPSNDASARMWLSPRDAVQLFQKAIEAPDVGFLVVYGASKIPDPFWRNPNAARIGYEPRDELGDMRSDEADRQAFQGGPYTAPDYGPEYGATGDDVAQPLTFPSTHRTSASPSDG
jgi:uronate dehydrogenase